MALDYNSICRKITLKCGIITVANVVDRQIRSILSPENSRTPTCMTQAASNYTMTNIYQSPLHSWNPTAA